MSNNPCFPRQVFRVVKLDEPRERFGQPNRLVTYDRFAWKDNIEGWYWVQRVTSWLYNSNDTDFGKEVPEHLYASLYNDYV